MNYFRTRVTNEEVHAFDSSAFLVTNFKPWGSGSSAQSLEVEVVVVHELDSVEERGEERDVEAQRHAEVEALPQHTPLDLTRLGFNEKSSQNHEF